MEQNPDILCKLKRVRRCGDGWIARCPAHEDRRPSLSISVRNGKLLVHCHAGCTFAAILAALGGPSEIGPIGNIATAEVKHEKRTAAEWKAMADSAIRDGKRRGTTLKLASGLELPVDVLEQFGVGWLPREAYTIPMWNAGGEIIGIQLRRADGNRFCVPGSRLGLFLPAYATAQSHKRLGSSSVIVCEGMSDAAAATAMGFVAIGRPSATGGTPLIMQYADRLSAIYTIVADNDEAGLLGAWKLAKRFGRTQPPISHRIIWPPWPHKDLRAWYIGNPKGARRTLAGYLA